MVNYSEKQILSNVRQGNNKEVFKVLYNNVLPQVKRFVTSNSGSVDEAFDVFQDAMVIFYKQVINGLFDESKYKAEGFIFAVSKRLWINVAKRKHVARKWESIQDFYQFEPSVLEGIISDEKKKVLDDVFSQIGDDCTKLLQFSVYNELSVKEIAKKINKNENLIRVQTYRCKNKLRDLVKGNASILNLLKN